MGQQVDAAGANESRVAEWDQGTGEVKNTTLAQSFHIVTAAV